MVQQSAGAAVRGVHGADEPPVFWQQFAHRGRLHLLEVGSAVDAPEVREVAHVVQLFGDDCEALGLHEVQAALRFEVSSCQKLLHLLSHRPLRLDHALELVDVAALASVLRPLAVLLHARADAYQQLLQTLAEDHQVEVAREQHLLILERIEVVRQNFV